MSSRPPTVIDDQPSARLRSRLAREADSNRRMKIFRNFIGGAWVEPASGEHFENVNPADVTDVIGRFPLSDATDVDQAVASAKRGFDVWRSTPAPARGDVLRRVGDLLASRKEDIADLMTREMGKPLQETRGDVQEGIDTAYYAATEGRRLFGHTVPSELRAKWAMSFRRPIGVCGLVTPFNFPLAIPTWKMFPALLCGNSVILKPAEDVPHTATVLVEILLEAGLPPVLWAWRCCRHCADRARAPGQWLRICRWNTYHICLPSRQATGSAPIHANWIAR